MTPATHIKRKRLNFSIQRALQIQMILRLVLILFVTLSISSLVYYYFADIKITSSFRLFHIHAKNFLDFLLPMVIGAFFISLGAGLAAVLFFPRHFVGSLYRIEEDVKKMAAGDLSFTIHLRRDDHHQALAENINQLVRMLKARLMAIQANTEHISELNATPAIPADTRAELEALCRGIRDELRSLKF